MKTALTPTFMIVLLAITTACADNDKDNGAGSIGTSGKGGNASIADAGVEDFTDSGLEGAGEAGNEKAGAGGVTGGSQSNEGGLAGGAGSSAGGVTGGSQSNEGGLAGGAGSEEIGIDGAAGAALTGGSGGGVICGSKVCSPGEVCCNASCGICTKPNESCIDLYCADAGSPETSCGNTHCDASEICCLGCEGDEPFCESAMFGCPDLDCEAPQCQIDSDCLATGYYCAKKEGQCLAIGVCMRIDAGMICTADCPGVCGCDGKQYCNACNARAAGVNVANQGACDCQAQDAVGQGMCEAFFGYAWDGSQCVGLSGCSCQGADCESTFSDIESCLNAYQVCLPDDCRTTGCEIGENCIMCWGNYACVPKGAVC